MSCYFAALAGSGFRVRKQGITSVRTSRPAWRTFPLILDQEDVGDANFQLYPGKDLGSTG